MNDTTLIIREALIIALATYGVAHLTLDIIRTLITRNRWRFPKRPRIRDPTPPPSTPGGQCRRP